MSKLKVPVSPRDHIRGGGLDAPVLLVEYGDYECPFCAATNPSIQVVEARYGDQLGVVFRHFPLSEIHPFARPAAEAAEYAGKHGKFWEMHDAIYANQQRLSMTLLFELAGRLKLPQVGLRDALTQRVFAERVEEDFVGGVRSGVNGTPTFFVNGERHNGGFSPGELAASIDDALLVSLA
jgi:protein-disulfide isomerase